MRAALQVLRQAKCEFDVFGLRLLVFWAWKSRRVGRPPLDGELVALIDSMASDNPLWSRRRA